MRIKPADIFDEIMPERLKAQVSHIRQANAVVLFKLSGPDGGEWTLDFTKPSDWIARGRTAAPRIVFSMSDDTFVRVYCKKLSPRLAGMLGRVKVEPMDLGMATKLLFLME
jgi:hypothetical protein